jgi:hypothetical protein
MSTEALREHESWSDKSLNLFSKGKDIWVRPEGYYYHTEDCWATHDSAAGEYTVVKLDVSKDGKALNKNSRGVTYRPDACISNTYAHSLGYW